MANQNSEEKRVPWGVVLITVGLIVAATAAAILFSPPATVQAVKANSQFPVVTVVVTAVPNAIETAFPSTEIILPEGFVSLEDAPRATLDNQPNRIVIPSIAVDAPVSAVGLSAFESDGQTLYQWQVPSAYEAGWHNTSAPLGQPGNTVLNGHNNIFGEVFRDLVDLQAGDEIIVYDADKPFSYTVADVMILPERDQPLAVRLENAKWILPTNDERLTLVSCWPYTDNTHRLIVVAYPTE